MPTIDIIINDVVKLHLHMDLVLIWALQPVVSICYPLKQQNPGNKVSKKTELVSIRINLTLDSGSQ